MEVKLQTQRYGKIDGLRSFAAIGIVLMHVQANLGYELRGFVFQDLIPSFTNLVFLFMIISGFAVCCGYYEKFATGQLSLVLFYKKRFAKVWPFFALLCLIDFAVSPSMESFYEVLANLTLCFGLIPNHGIEVIGVGWFLGLVFVFYFLFPFFCYLLSDKKRAWFALLVAYMLNFLSENYFGVGRESIAYSAVFFMIGGILYIYRIPLQKMANRMGWLVVLIISVALVVYFEDEASVSIMLVLYSSILVFAMRDRKYKVDFLDNSVTKWIGSISMEIYLSHMMIFRVLEMVILDKTIGLPQIQLYFVFSLFTLMGTIVFSFATQKGFQYLGKLLKSRNDIRRY